jgi:hypothetical protein
MRGPGIALRDRAFTSAITNALSALLDQPGQIQHGQVFFLKRQQRGHSLAPSPYMGGLDHAATVESARQPVFCWHSS